MSQELLETGLYFSTALYSIKKPEYLDVVTKVFDEGVQASKAQVPINDVHPMVMTGNLFLDERLKEFAQFISGTAWNILDSQGFSMVDKATYFMSMWGQEHYKTSDMPEHIHGEGTQIVGFYFLECPENSSVVVFHDPRTGKKQINFAEKDATKITNASSVVSMKPEKGTMFFTNAWLPHSFTRHASDEPLKFIHFNLGVQYYKSPEAIVV